MSEIDTIRGGGVEGLLKLQAAMLTHSIYFTHVDDSNDL